MRLNKNMYAKETAESARLRSEIKDVLLTKRTVGMATQAIIYIVQNEIAKHKVTESMK